MTTQDLSRAPSPTPASPVDEIRASGPGRARREPLRVLWLTTKAPLPARDGGRLAVKNTLEALAAVGHRLTVVAPASAGAEVASLKRFCDPQLVAGRPLARLRTIVRTRFRREPFSIARHRSPAVARAVARLLRERDFDVVHVEQLQALSSVIDGGAAVQLPVVMRAQNIESDLWSAAASVSSRLVAVFARREARHLEHWEGAAVRRVAATIAFSEEDAARLRELGGPDADVRRIPLPFPPSLPPATGTLRGSPALVLLGSRGWLPNEDAAVWFVREHWPTLRQAFPDAVLHLLGAGAGLGGRDPRLHFSSLPDSGAAFAAGAILVLPLRIGTGVRLRILEGWARGVPVVASPVAARGLAARDGVNLLLAQNADEFTQACRRLVEDGELWARLVAGGRDTLRRHHDPTTVAAMLTEVYDEVVARQRQL